MRPKDKIAKFTVDAINSKLKRLIVEEDDVEDYSFSNPFAGETKVSLHTKCGQTKVYDIYRYSVKELIPSTEEDPYCICNCDGEDIESMDDLDLLQWFSNAIWDEDEIYLCPTDFEIECECQDIYTLVAKPDSLGYVGKLFIKIQDESI